jgi:cyclohexanecarboxylate-CoA ligase
VISPTRNPTEAYEPDCYPSTTLDGHLARAAELHPDGLAIVEGRTRLSFAALAQEVAAFAGGLASIGVRRGDVVTIVLPNWWEAMVAIQAALRLGAIVNPVVPIYRALEIGFILNQAMSSAVIIPHRFRNFDYVEMMEGVIAGLRKKFAVVVVRSEGTLPAGYVPFAALASERTLAGHAGGMPSDVALLLYTSGTTADPKGVLHTHETLDYEVRSIVRRFGLGNEDTVFMPSPLTHITGFLYGAIMPPMLEATAVYLDIWHAETGFALIEDHACRFIMAATPFLRSLVEIYEARGATSSLRTFLCGGADVPPTLIRHARDVMGSEVSRIYGSSEFPTFCAARPGDGVSVAADTDGIPISPATFRLEDSADEGGELLVKGPEMFAGYSDPALNAEAFTDDGYFRTGDLARVDAQGAITICGRSKDIINRGGEKISAKQVEDILHRHDAISQAAVVGMPDDRMVEKMCAFVVPNPGAEPTMDEIVRFLKGAGLARQKLPERLEIVPAFPMTASGKVQKFKLRQMLIDEKNSLNNRLL